MYHVDVSCKEDSVFEVTSGEAKVTIDLSGKNLSPLPALLAAVGSCTAVYLRRYADNLKLPIKEFSISVDADLVKEPQMSFKKVSIAIDLKGAQLDEAKREGLIRFVQNCPVGNTLRGNTAIDIKLK